MHVTGSSLLPISFGGRFALAGSAPPTMQIEPDVRGDLFRDGESGSLVHGRIRFVDGHGAGDGATSGRIHRRWRDRGDAVLQDLAGEYLLALWDGERGSALLAADRFSTLPLFWARNGTRIGFSAVPERAARLAGLSLEVDWEALHAYAYFHMIPAPMSIYRGVRRLDVGEALRIEAGDAEVIRYWVPEFDERRRFEFAAEREEFLAALRAGVAECIGSLDRERLGCFLSGGTDSSTIAGLATRHFDAPARTFAIGFDVGGYDETHYSRLAARHFGTEHTEYFVTADDVHAGIEAVATQYEQPFGNSSALPTFFCARLARDAGIERMLGGDGGDELYAGNERYAKQAVFAMYGKVPAIARSLFEPVLFGAFGDVDARLFAKARSYVEQAKEPLPDRIQSRYNLLNHLGASSVFTDAVLANVSLDGPLQLEREVWNRARLHDSNPGPMSQVNRFLAWDFKFTLADSDLPKVTRMCQAAGVEVAFPMLTHALVEHSLRLRPDEKLKGRRLRHFFKESLRGFLPDEILAKKKHGFGLPFGSWVLSHERLRRTADDALRSLSSRGIVRAEFLGHLREQLSSGHPGYYGTMVWILMILELWLRGSPLADLRVNQA
jgi:asparagine synthase (glutamine-hydrolysing)